MTPKEKAEELIELYKSTIMFFDDDIDSKKCAFMTVNECIESTKQLIHHYTKGDDKKYSDIYLSMSLSVQYWQEVKQEIKKL